MMRKICFMVFLILMMGAPLYAAQSTIKVAEGSACMGDDKSRKQTEIAALADAKRNAVESVKTYLSSATEVKDYELQQDMVSAYARATVEVLETLDKTWYKDPLQGDCFRIKLKTEVIPDEKSIMKAGERDRNTVFDDPSLPLAVKVWTDKSSYSTGEKIKIYLKGNKPFYARLIYRDASKANLQLLPNPYRQDNYFQGGVVYEVPSGKDQFELEVNPPFGEESIILYASVTELGDLKLQPTGGIYAVKTKERDIGSKTRGVKVKAAPDGKYGQVAEFSEQQVLIRTGK
ncbi:MAG TPA: DUF4384 domain-containing protein [Smithellaceae bacterium]|nr:DUF4384 domain-containing protein [Smithellaceae bacterium]HQM45237.1 DUF4384 domain-containing protein [Smithellaceae bacterium]